MRIANEQAGRGSGASPLARSIETPLRCLLRVSGGLCAALAVAILSGLLVFELWWADPESLETWPAHVSALGAWIFLQTAALALLSAGLSRLIGRSWTP